MKDRPNRSARSVPPTAGRARAPQRGGGRAPKRNSRNRQLLAVGALVLVLALVAGAVILLQQNQPSAGGGSITGSLPNEEAGHFRGSATASVVVTEWSDFQ